MKQYWQRAILAMVLSIGLCAGFSAVAGDDSERLTVGGALPRVALEDQFEKPQQIDESDTLLLFAADMDAAGLVKQAFVEHPTDPFAGAGIRYVADISAMPSIIAAMFAKPKMRDYPYSVILDEAGDVTQNWPRLTGQVTVLRLQQLRLTEVSYCADTGCLAELVALARGKQAATMR